jgi:hypothetical protein
MRRTENERIENNASLGVKETAMALYRYVYEHPARNTSVGGTTGREESAA